MVSYVPGGESARVLVQETHGAHLLYPYVGEFPVTGFLGSCNLLCALNALVLQPAGDPAGLGSSVGSPPFISLPEDP